MPAKKLSREQVREKAKSFYARYKVNGRSAEEAAELAIAEALSDAFKYRDKVRELRTEIDAGGGNGGSNNGDSSGRVAALERTIDNLRREIDEHESTIADLEAKLPGNGARVLTAEEATQYETITKAIAEHKIEAGKLADALKDGAAARDKVATFERRSVFAEAAKALGYDAEVLEEVVGLKGLHLEMKEVQRFKLDALGNPTKERETVKVPHVRSAANASEALAPLDEYVENNLSKFVPALTATDDDGSQDRSNNGSSGSGSTTGVRMPAQPGKQKEKKPGGDVAAAVTGYATRTFVTPSERAKASAGKE